MSALQFRYKIGLFTDKTGFPTEIRNAFTGKLRVDIVRLPCRLALFLNLPVDMVPDYPLVETVPNYLP